MRMLALPLLAGPPRPRIPRLLITLPIEDSVDVEFERRRSELARLIDHVIQDDGRVELVARVLELSKGAGEP